jgi:uncharacterized protein (DUF1778 family)
MSALNLRLPNSIHRHIKEIAQKDGVSINSFINSAVSEKISAITTDDYISKRAQKSKKGTLNTILKKVPSRDPLPEDRF